MFTIKDFVIDVLEDQLDEYEDSTICGGDLAYTLLESYNTDGTYTYDTYAAMGWVKLHFEEISDIIAEMKKTGFCPVDVFENPEAFQVQIMLFVAGDLLGQCETVTSFWDDEIILEKNIIDKIKEELENL